MRRAFVAALTFSLAAVAALNAAERGRAEGALVINGTAIPLTYAYAAGNYRDETTNRDRDTKIVLTDRELPAGFDLHAHDDVLPDGTHGIILCIDGKQATHVFLQHAGGTYDAGWFTGPNDYHFKARRSDRGTVGGTLKVEKPITTATIEFTCDVSFDAEVR